MTTFREIDRLTVYSLYQYIFVFLFVSNSGFRGRTLELIVTVPYRLLIISQQIPYIGYRCFNVCYLSPDALLHISASGETNNISEKVNVHNEFVL